MTQIGCPSTINISSAHLNGPTFRGSRGSGQGMTLTGTVKYEDLYGTWADEGTAAIKGYGSDSDDEPSSRLWYTELWRQE